MKLQTLLKEYNFNLNRVKLIRHPLNKPDVKTIYERGFIESYQAEQSKPVFDDCDYILSFLGTSGTKAKFIGCYKVGERFSAGDKRIKIPENFPYPEMYNSCFYYNLKPVEMMGDLKNRLIIEWGNAARMWHQWATNEKEIIAIYPSDNFRELTNFKSYEEVILSFDELETIVNDKITYNDWTSALSNVNGIYLILDKETGQQYIGSTYNTDGILGRWSNYVKTHNGGDVGLIDELETRPEAYKNFQFTILKNSSKNCCPGRGNKC